MLRIAVAGAERISNSRPAVDKSAIERWGESGRGRGHADRGDVGRCCYLSEAIIIDPGRDPLIARTKFHGFPKDTSGLDEPGEGAPPIQKMTYRLANETRRVLYRQCSRITDTPFRDAKHNLRFCRFKGRDLAGAEAKFALHAMVHNVMRLISSGRIVVT